MSTTVFNRVVKAEHKVANALLRGALELPLRFDDRQAMPAHCTASNGSTVHCAIDEPVEVGDRLVSNANTWAVVSAAPEDLLCVPLGQSNVPVLMYIAGHQYWPLQVCGSAVHLVASQECQQQLEALGLQFEIIQAPLHELALPTHQHDDHDHDHEGCTHHHHNHNHDHTHDHDHSQCGHHHEHHHNKHGA